MIRNGSTVGKRSVLIIGAVCACILIAGIVLNMVVAVVGGRSICRDETVPFDSPYDCILVLGAGLRDDGSPSDMLADRLKTATELYQTGVSAVVLLSGDRSGDYDEVSAMAAYCREAGVPEEAIAYDFEGFSTFESLRNAREAGYRRMILVTQRYHLYRALYIADGLGAEAVGVSASLRSYRGQWFRDAREVFARIKDFCLVAVY